MREESYWIAIGDIHNNQDKAASIPGIRDAAGIIVTGDLTFLGGTKDAQKVMDGLAALNPRIWAQIGNMDKPELTPWLGAQGINLHGEAKRIHPEVTVIGVGGSNKTPFNTPSEFSEDEIAAILQSALKQAGEYKNLVLVSHTPPLNTNCDRINGGAHVGSTAVREFIEKTRPVLCLCGHIHEARAEDRIGDTLVINPGALADGGYVRVDLTDEGLKAGLVALE